MHCPSLRPLAVAAMLLMASSTSHASFDRRYSPSRAAETFFSGPGQLGPAPTEAPISLEELRKRQEPFTARAGTCGYEYFGTSLSQSITCQSAGAECRTDPIFQARGCCDPRNCVVATTCMPRTASSAIASSTAVDLRTLYCFDADSPACGVYQFEDDTDSNSMYFCAPTATTSTIRFNLLAASASSSASSGSSSDQTSSTTSSASQAATTTAAPAPASTPVGAIVGGVVGGVAGIALLCFLAWFCLIRRKKNNNAPDQPPQQHMSQPMLAHQQYNNAPAQFPMGVHGQQAPMYDNRGSIAKPQTEGYYHAVPATGSPGQAISPWNPPSQGQHYQQPGYGPPPGLVEAPAQNQPAELPVTRPDGELRELQ